MNNEVKNNFDGIESIEIDWYDSPKPNINEPQVSIEPSFNGQFDNVVNNSMPEISQNTVNNESMINQVPEVQPNITEPQVSFEPSFNGQFDNVVNNSMPEISQNTVNNEGMINQVPEVQPNITEPQVSFEPPSNGQFNNVVNNSMSQNIQIQPNIQNNNVMPEQKQTSIIDEIREHQIKQMEQEKQNGQQQKSGITFMIVLLVLLLAFIFALPFISKIL